MLQAIIIALGAGVASAVLFTAPINGSMMAALFSVASPLPLMIAFLGFGRTAGFVAAATGIAVVAFLVHPLASLAFFGWAAAPAVCLSALALWRRSDAGLLAAAAAGFAAILAISVIGAALVSYRSWDSAVNDVAATLTPWLNALRGRGLPNDLPDGLTTSEIARMVIRFSPAIGSAWMTLTLCVNLWVAGRLSLASKLLSRPWPNVPDTLRLNRALGLLLPVAIACSFLAGAAGAVALCAAASLGAAFALQGLGALHAITRGLSMRNAILIGAYAVVIGLMPWPLALAAGLGVLDCFAPLPRKPALKP